MSERDSAGAPGRPADAVLCLTVRAGGRLEVWRRDGCSATDFVAELRRIAEQFERGDVQRVS
jgi:hypothetical protein